jgi:signal transduction histidine kinase
MSSTHNASRPKVWAMEAAEHGEKVGHSVLMRDGEAWCETCGQVWQPVREQRLQRFTPDNPQPTMHAKRLAHGALPQVPDRTDFSDPAVAQTENVTDSGDEVLPVALHELRGGLRALGSKLEGILLSARTANPDIDVLADQVEGAVRHVSTMSRLIDELLNVSQSQSDD